MENNKPAEFYKGKKVFVTGHTGFKGSWLITWLHSLGAEVMGYSLTPQSEPNKKHLLFNIIKDHILFEDMEGDIRATGYLAEVLINFKPDIIFHLAAQPLVLESYKHPARTFEINTTGTANLLEAVTELTGKCSVVIITTDKVYTETGKCYTEEDPIGGYDPYSASKAAAEIVTDCFRNSFFSMEKFPQHQKTIATARAGNVIGGGDTTKGRLMVDIKDYLFNKCVIPIRNPFAIRPFQHVLECLHGYLLLGMKMNDNYFSGNSAFNFGPDILDHIPVYQVADIVIKKYGLGLWANTGTASSLHEAKELFLDSTKAFKLLGWKPVLTAEEAIGLTMDWYITNLNHPEKMYEYTLGQIKQYEQLI